MASLRNRPLPAFNAVAPGNVATLDFPLGRAYGAIWLVFGDANGTTLASGNAIGDVTMLVNDKPQRQLSGFQLNALNSSNGPEFAAKSYGVAGTAGYRTLLPIYLDEPWRKGVGQSAAPRWYANGIDSLQLQVSIPAGLTSPVIQAFGEWDVDTKTPLGAITKYLRNTYNATGTTVEVSNLAKQDFYQAMYFFPTSDGKYVSQMQFVADGDFYREAMPYQVNQAILLGRSMNPDLSATPRFDLVFDYTDPIQDFLPGAARRDLSFKATLNAASTGTMDVISVRTGGLQ